MYLWTSPGFPKTNTVQAGNLVIYKRRRLAAASLVWEVFASDRVDPRGKLVWKLRWGLRPWPPWQSRVGEAA